LYADTSFRRGVAVLGAQGLTYDTWHYHYQNQEFLELAKAVPNTTMVLDHFGTPLGVGSYASQREQIFEQWKKEHESSSRNFEGVEYYMLHSLSHMLLGSLALECGYPLSSLRERVYAMDGKYGILIYTGSSDAEGTLGGLIDAGRRISRHLQRALRDAKLCSNDPVCSHHDPVKKGGQNLSGSACHGCLLVPETSCEQFNNLLDRSLVVPTLESSDAAFFKL
jgi:hypothetical protein